MVDASVIGNNSFQMHTEFWLNFRIKDMLSIRGIKSYQELTASVDVTVSVNTYLSS